MAPRGARYTTALRGAMPLRVASTDGLGVIQLRQRFVDSCVLQPEAVRFMSTNCPEPQRPPQAVDNMKAA